MRRPDVAAKNSASQKKNRKQAGNKHNYRGDRVGYAAVHARLRASRIGICVQCDARGRTNMALINGRGTVTDSRGQVYSVDLNDYRELCRRCHSIDDNRIRHLAHRRTDGRKCISTCSCGRHSITRPTLSCDTCGNMYNPSWMTRHKREGKCVPHV